MLGGCEEERVAEVHEGAPRAMQMETRAAMGLATAATTKPDLFFWFNYSITNPDSVVGVVAGSERNKAWHTAHA